jgi:pimeloyl-ACP methyl ester carboxylesterase
MTLQPFTVDVPQAALDDLGERLAGQEAGGGYTHKQRTRPQILAYGLADSPVGLAAWILDKWREWSDWVTGTIGTSFRSYRDWALGMQDRPETWRLPGRNRVPAGEQLQVPVAVALFDYRCPREWAERAYSDLRRFTDMPRGGHFTAMEEPELLAQDLRGFFREVQ